MALTSLITLALSLGLAQGWSRLALAVSALLALGLVLRRLGAGAALWPALRRVRWLLLALWLLAWWWAPPALSALPLWSGPLGQSLLQSLVLLVLVAAAVALQQGYPRETLVAALALGTHRRLAVRLWLVLEALPSLEQRARQGLAGDAGEPPASASGRLRRLAGVLGDWLDEPPMAPGGPAPLQLPRLAPAPGWQWGLPLGLLLWPLAGGV